MSALQLSKAKPSNSKHTPQKHMDLFHSIESGHAKQHISQQCPMSNRARVYTYICKHTHTHDIYLNDGNKSSAKDIFVFVY